MCEPVTLGILAGAGAGTAASVYGSASLLQAATIGLTVGSGVMQVGADYQANKQERIAAGLREQQFKEQEERYKAQAEARDLETTQIIVNRKKDYLRNLSANKAWMATTGATMTSPSFQALLRDNEDTYRQDLSNIGLMGLEAKVESLSMARDSRIARESIGPELKTSQRVRNLNTLTNVAQAGLEVGNVFGSPSTSRKPRNELKRAAAGTGSYEKLRQSLLGRQYGY